MERTVNRPGVERRRQIVTVGAGTLLIIVMGAVLLIGSRYASRLTSNVGALQTASSLTGYPALLNEQLSALRDRLEARAYAGQALNDLRNATETFDRVLKRLTAANA